MVTVYVWNYLGPKHVGHASMKCGSTYISWWPAKDRFGWFEKVAPLMGRTFEEDKGDKHKSPNRTIHLGRLDETAIKNWWRRVGLSWNGQQIQGPPHVPYIATSINCSKIVAIALKVGGGDRYAGWSKPLTAVWNPNHVWEYAWAIGQQM